MAMAEGIKAGLYIKNLLSDLINFSLPILVQVDNSAAKAFSEHDGCNQRTKHVDIRYHFVRDYINLKWFEPAYVRSEDNLADLLTKILDGPTQFRHCAHFFEIEPLEQGGVLKSG